MAESQVVTNVENFKFRVGSGALSRLLKNLKMFKMTKLEDDATVEFSMYAKAYGISINSSQAHTFEFSVLYGSEDVAFLTKVKEAQKAGVFMPISCVDTDGGGEWSAAVMVIQKTPVVEYSKDADKLLTYTAIVPFLEGGLDSIPTIIGVLF